MPIIIIIHWNVTFIEFDTRNFNQNLTLPFDTNKLLQKEKIIRFTGDPIVKRMEIEDPV